MSNATITPYLFFSGRCEEALDFYKRALGAEVIQVMRFHESPDPVPEGMLQPGFENKIMHSAFRIQGTTMMASDGCNDQAKFNGFSLALTLGDENQAKQYFFALSEGGTVVMPIGPTFWSPCYGIVTDAFGVQWMVMVLENPCA
jgi:PhnB protein